MMIDIGPATVRMADLLASVSDDQLELPTPCPATPVGQLVDHIGTLTVAFTSVARKETVGAPSPPSATNLEDGWRDRIARDLDTLAQAWQDGAAWAGMTVAGGIDLPGEVAGLVVLDELLVHGWDIMISIGAPSIGRGYEPSPAEIEAAASFVASFDAPRDGNLFGPVVPVPAEAPPFDRLLGLTGRDPKWKPTTP
jgi:uncharacterized protein (TIGR03086 family)